VTAVNNFPIYLEQIFHLSDTVKSLVIISILVTSAIGAFITGWVADKTGLKKTLNYVLGAWVIVFPLLAVTTSFPFFVVLCTLVGFLYGSMWAVTRTAMVALVPKDKLNFGFSYYTLAERTSTFIGPLAWGIVTAVTLHLGAVRYRYALFAMTLFVAIGIYILARIPKKLFNRSVGTESLKELQ
jgi:UMF1 family MFS transporter